MKTLKLVAFVYFNFSHCKVHQKLKDNTNKAVELKQTLEIIDLFIITKQSV